MARFEVRCESCQATFPPETKHCLHCGARLRRVRDRGPSDPRIFKREAGRSEELEELPPDLGQEEIETPRPRRALRIGTGVIWVLLALLGSLYRLCSGEG